MKILHINCNYILSSLHQCLIEKLNAAGFSNDVFVATYDKKREQLRKAKSKTEIATILTKEIGEDL
ncbi:hypothetical protein EfmAA290_19980 [Enterococcus faecium]|nr:hypothetical protein EfmAA290_19980 [Enterococcus faecium]